MPHHPDPEQLAAWQAGELDEPHRGRVAVHVRVCRECEGVVVRLDDVRDQLNRLPEPALPDGLHNRLAALVETEVQQLKRDRRRAWQQRPVAWAAAALILFIFIIGTFSLLRVAHSGGYVATVGRAQDAHQEESGGVRTAVSPPASGALPVVRMTGEFSTVKLRAAVATNTVARQAYQQARARLVRPSSALSEASPEGPRSQSAIGDQTACVDRVIPKGDRVTVTPAFFVNATFEGRAVRVLVVVESSARDRVRYWVFPAGSCAGMPLADGQVDIKVP